MEEKTSFLHKIRAREIMKVTVALFSIVGAAAFAPTTKKTSTAIKASQFEDSLGVVAPTGECSKWICVVSSCADLILVIYCSFT